MAAVQLAKLAGQCDFFTALGNDENGRLAHERLEELGVTVFAPRAASRSAAASSTSTATASARSPSSASGSSPQGDDDLPWDRLDGPTPCTSAAATRARSDRPGGPAARRDPARVRHAAGRGGQARRARALGQRPGRAAGRARARPGARLVVSTAGKEGGEWVGKDHTHRHWKAAELPGPRRDAYGAGDSFAAGLTYALGADMRAGEALRSPPAAARTSSPAAPPTTTSSRRLNSEHRRALDPAGAQPVERLLGLLERELLHGGADRAPAARARGTRGRRRA